MSTKEKWQPDMPGYEIHRSWSPWRKIYEPQRSSVIADTGTMVQQWLASDFGLCEVRQSRLDSPVGPAELAFLFNTNGGSGVGSADTRFARYQTNGMTCRYHQWDLYPNYNAVVGVVKPEYRRDKDHTSLPRLVGLNLRNIGYALGDNTVIRLNTGPLLLANRLATGAYVRLVDGITYDGDKASIPVLHIRLSPPMGVGGKLDEYAEVLKSSEHPVAALTSGPKVLLEISRRMHELGRLNATDTIMYFQLDAQDKLAARLGNNLTPEEKEMILNACRQLADVRQLQPMISCA